jgi:hypothetical protein
VTPARGVDPRQLPALARVLEVGVFDENISFDASSDADFDFGLQLYLDGLSAFINRVCGEQ